MMSLSKRPSWSREIVFLIALQVLIYSVTFSKVPASDGLRYISDIETRNWQYMLLPNHVFPEALILIIFELLHKILPQVTLLQVMQGMNVVLSSACTAIFYGD